MSGSEGRCDPWKAKCSATGEEGVRAVYKYVNMPPDLGPPTWRGPFLEPGVDEHQDMYRATRVGNVSIFLIISGIVCSLSVSTTMDANRSTLINWTLANDSFPCVCSMRYFLYFWPVGNSDVPGVPLWDIHVEKGVDLPCQDAYACITCIMQIGCISAALRLQWRLARHARAQLDY